MDPLRFSTYTKAIEEPFKTANIEGSGSALRWSTYTKAVDEVAKDDQGISLTPRMVRLPNGTLAPNGHINFDTYASTTVAAEEDQLLKSIAERLGPGGDTGESSSAPPLNFDQV